MDRTTRDSDRRGLWLRRDALGSCSVCYVLETVAILHGDLRTHWIAAAVVVHLAAAHHWIDRPLTLGWWMDGWSRRKLIPTRGPRLWL